MYIQYCICLYIQIDQNIEYFGIPYIKEKDIIFREKILYYIKVVLTYICSFFFERILKNKASFDIKPHFSVHSRKNHSIWFLDKYAFILTIIKKKIGTVKCLKTDISILSVKAFPIDLREKKYVLRTLKFHYVNILQGTNIKLN